MKIKNLNINNKLLYALVILIILPLVILLILSLSPNNQDMRDINKICRDIENCNSSLKSSLKDSGLDLAEAESIISSALPQLNSIKDNLCSLEVTNEKNSIKDALLETLNYNIKLYESCLNLIQNPKDNEIVSKYNDYSNTYSLFLKDYQSLETLGLDTTLSTDTKEFFKRSFDYFGTIIKINRDTDIHMDQKKTYVINLENCINSFDSINEDLKPALEKIKQDKRSLDVLLKDIKEKKSKLDDIKNKSYNLSVPEGGSDCYNLLQNTINLYGLYVNSLEDSIITDKTSNDSNNSDDIEKNYTNSFSKYTDFIHNFKDLRAELDNFNKK
ncbi:hypothetical protein NNC19_16045 [Clostridium sp. SHJSY1]|uniref:hypothetical protein n=1 Tax=Clostridium sp. SHJSY1 TaxID=2942483 RepID=UPI002874D14A|nr:hypothetical protein [Clostridium sp. SHJSY1]MDS0527204.1 hypothetical protein [Clostridium sp. SHJSY1]